MFDYVSKLFDKIKIAFHFNGKKINNSKDSHIGDNINISQSFVVGYSDEEVMNSLEDIHLKILKECFMGEDGPNNIYYIGGCFEESIEDKMKRCAFDELKSCGLLERVSGAVHRIPFNKKELVKKRLGIS